MRQINSSEMIYVSLRTYYHTDVCSMCLGFYHLFNAIKTATCWCAESSSKLILQRKMATFIARKRMASFLDSGRNVTVEPYHSADADGYLFNIRSLFKRRCCLIISREEHSVLHFTLPALLSNRLVNTPQPHIAY